MEKSRNKFGAKAQSGALSGPRAVWQSCSAWGLARSALGLAAIAGLAAPAFAEPNGPAFTVRRGEYVCEMPGTALTVAGLRRPEEDFTIRQGSIYSTSEGRGSYLATGDEIHMTTGPKRGERFRRVSENFLRKLTSEGKETDLRCIRRVANNRY